MIAPLQPPAAVPEQDNAPSDRVAEAAPGGQNAAPAAGAPAAASAGAAASGVRPPGFWLAAVALAVAAGATLLMWQRAERVESEATRRLQAADERAAKLDATLQQAVDELRDLRNRSAVMESKLAEAEGLQVQLEKLYRSLAQDSLEVALAEMESALTLAAQQLALGSSPQAVLTALQEIDARAARQNDPTLGPLRRALLADIDRLRAYPAADLGTLALRLDGLIASVDQYPLVSSLQPAAREARAASSQAEGGSVLSPSMEAAASGLQSLRRELQQLFRVRRIDTPDVLLVAPEEAYFARENLRLLLLNARLALLSRNDALYRGDLERAGEWMSRYFDRDSRAVSGAIAQLRQLQGAKVALEPPSVAESLRAVKAARAARETSR